MADGDQAITPSSPVFLAATKLSLTMRRDTEEALGMTVRQWQRLRQRITACAHRIDRWDQAQNISLGVFLTAILPAIDQFKGGAGYTWIVLAAVSAAVWVTAMAAQRTAVESQKSSIASVLEDMDDIQSQFAITATSTTVIQERAGEVS
jgi:hypothetical protein